MASSLNVRVRVGRSEAVVVRFGRSEQLGAQIVHFSLPRDITCPGATVWCRKFCYARYGRHIFPSVRKARVANVELAERPDFVRIMVEAIEKIHSKGIRVLRLHEEGDFYSIEYIKKWIEIIKELRRRNIDIFVYAYTRSWRIPTMLPYLEELRKLPRVQIIASTDSETGPGPEGWSEAGINFTYAKPGVMCTSDRKPSITCTECGVCLRGRVNVYFNVPNATI
jgi:hypothetical protein